MINTVSALLLCLPLVAIANKDMLEKAQIGRFKVGNEAQLLSLVSSGFIGLTGAAYLQSLKDRKKA